LNLRKQSLSALSGCLCIVIWYDIYLPLYQEVAVKWHGQKAGHTIVPAAHCDTLISCALEIFLLTYLLTY